MNSRNRAPSTGRLPPLDKSIRDAGMSEWGYTHTPSPMQPNSSAVMIHEGPAATNVPKTPHMSNVALKAGLRPIISDATPQKVDPIDKPMNVISVVVLTLLLETPNSDDSWGSTSARP
jgi:hypothetical protein